MLRDNLPENFCPVPWMHTHITPQSERRLCCISREKARWQPRISDIEAPEVSEYSPLTLEQHWNSEKMKSIRQRMLSGETLPECDNCNSRATNPNPYKLRFIGNISQEQIDEILEKTSPDGSTTLVPTSYDYRVSNLCNFKCRMCSEHSSSSFEVEKRLHGLINTQQKWLLPENRTKVSDFQSEVVEEELWKAARSGVITDLYWAGGEPLMLNLHWDIMEYLVETDQAKNIEVRYNTNLSKFSHKNRNLLELISGFKKASVNASMDGTGDIAEYIRTGLDWDTWVVDLKKLLQLRDIHGMDSVALDVTLTIPGLFSMKSLMDFVVENNIQCYVKQCFSANARLILSPMAIQYDVLEEMLKDILEYEETLNSDLTKPFRAAIFGMLDKNKSFEIKYPNYKSELLLGKKYQEKLESIRPNTKLSMRQILEANPKVLAWWDSIK